MIELRRVAVNPWDFTLYRSDDGTHVMKVIFSEGQYKMDVERYFVLDSPIDQSYDLDDLKSLSATIRSEFPDTALRQLSKSDLTFTK